MDKNFDKIKQKIKRKEKEDTMSRIKGGGSRRGAVVNESDQEP